MSKNGVWHTREVELLPEAREALLRTETAIAQKLACFAQADGETGMEIEVFDLNLVTQALTVIEQIHCLRYADLQAKESVEEA